jgi:hypothetical protein
MNSSNIICLSLAILLLLKVFVYFVAYETQPTNIEVLIILFSAIMSTTNDKKGCQDE